MPESAANARATGVRTIGLFSFVGSLIGGGKAKKASKKAAQLQYDAAMAGVRETQRQFDATRADFAPYQQAGTDALAQLRALMGLNGAEEQQSEIAALRETPLYKSLYGAGEEAVLANAAATGGLRGGNTQRSLAEFGEDTLASLIERQLSGYGGLVGVGAGASGAVGNFGANAVAAMNELRNQGAGAKAQDVLTRGGINSQNWQNAGGFLDNAISAFLPGGGGFMKALF